MFNILTKVHRVPVKSKQCIQHILFRTYCYKPVERKHIASSQQILNRKKRRKFTQFIDYGVNVNVGRIKPARDGGRSLRLIEKLPCEPSEFDSRLLIETFDKLGDSMYGISDEALIHENFNTIIDASKVILPKLTVSQNVHIFGQICRANVPMFDELTEIVVNNLIRSVTLMNVNEIIQVDYSLRNYYAKEMKVSKLFETLRQSTRTAFIVKVNYELVDSQSCENLMRIVKYLSNNQSLVKNVDTKSLAEQLLLKDDYEFQLNDAICIIVTLARYPKLDEHSQQLLTKMFRIWCNKTTNIEGVKEILRLLVAKKSKDNDLSAFQDSQFISHCIKLTIQKNDLRTGFDVLSRFNDLNMTSSAIPRLIDFLSIVFDSDKLKRLKVDDYATFCIACDKANYKPLNFHSKIVPAIERARLEETNFHKQVDLALTLKNLGIHHESFIDYLLKSAEIQVLYKNDNRLNEINNAYSVDEVTPTDTNINPTYLTWLMADLENFIGSNKIIRNVPLSKELTIPLVMKVNTKTGNFIDIRDTLVTKNDNELIIGVLTQDVGSVEDNFESVAEILNKKRKLIKEKGWIAITLDESLYGSMETYKRAFTFFKIIVYAINNRKSNRKV